MTGEADVVEGTVVRVTFSNDDTGFRVVRVRPDTTEPRSLLGRATRDFRDRDADLITVVGRFPAVSPGEVIRAVGTRENDARHGDQLRADIVTAVTPTSAAGIERYLGSGIVKGVGRRTAAKVVEQFGERTIHVLDNEPERLREVSGLGRARADALSSAWRTQRAVRELMVVLSSLQISPALATRIHKKYGEHALRVVRETPYRLALEVFGVGFKTADAIARNAGIAIDDPQRAQAGVLHTLETLAEEGHTVTPRLMLVERAALLLDPAASTDPRKQEPPDAKLMSRADEAIDVLHEAQRISFETEGVASALIARHEAGLAASLRKLLSIDPATKGALPGAAAAMERFEATTGITLAKAQRAAIEQVAHAPVVVVTGGPGVGKTTVVRAILSLFEAAGLKTALAAPTGRAAKRMAEATARSAMTIHRLLEVDPRAQRFQRDEDNPLELGALVIDESSMVDVTLAHALVRAIPRGARLVLVGDVDQLPSVGAGAFLRDVIESGVIPTARLTEVFRQAGASRIVAGAHAILRGEEPTPSPSSSEASEAAGPTAATGELFLVERREPEDAAKTIVDIVHGRIPKAFGFDARRDVQVLVPMVRGVVGTRALNLELQARLNPRGPAVQRGDTVFRVGDRVMQIRNDYDRDVFNGDMGHVLRVGSDDDAAPSELAGDDEKEKKRVVLVVRLEEGRDVEYEAEDLDELTLAYACTVHKAQGSEYPAVVIGLVNQHYVMLARKLLYTAVTRARKLVVIVGSRWALREAVRDARGEERRTTLSRRLRATSRRGEGIGPS